MVKREADNLIGESSSFLECLEHASRVAELNRPVLVVGERGTGKELIAERIHYLSARWDQALVKLNCAAINENLLESELFGHEAGSFTGAKTKRAGRFELAHEGTLFLDELATSSSLVQEKLLRVIEYGEFERVGGSSTLSVNVRLIAATNDDLPLLAEQHRFRHDLLDRLAFDVITLPPLRHRTEDILLLAHHFAVKMSIELGEKVFRGFSKSVEETLLNHSWPGNIRELKNVIERSVYRWNSDRALDHLVLDPFESPYRPSLSNEQTRVDSTTSRESEQKGISFPIELKTHIQQSETTIIEQALKQAQFNQKKTADLLGLTYHQLRGYLKKYNMLDGQSCDE